MRRALSPYPSPHSFDNKIARMIWTIVSGALYRSSPRICHGWRRFLLRLFGATIGEGVHPYPSARIWAPWNLRMDDHSSLGDHVDCYCVGQVHIGAHSTVSQYTFLCTGSHAYTDIKMPLIVSPIHIGERVWVAADAFIGPGATIGDGAVVGARSSVFGNVEAWTVVAGSPARVLKKRIFGSLDDGKREEVSDGTYQRTA